MTSPAALYPGTCYHLFNRGNNRENIFPSRDCYPLFLHLYTYHIAPFVETYAYCLLRNHYHLLVRVRSESEILRWLGRSRIEEKKLRLLPSRHFSNFFNAYAKKINLIFHRTGSLFQHPFRRVVVGDDRQLRTVIAYIHQNPERHRLVEDYRDWPFSSYHVLKQSSVVSENPVAIARVVPQNGKPTSRFSGKELAPLLLDDVN
jgi:putative transposase